MANEFLDQYVRHQIYLQRFGSFKANEFDDFIKKADEIILGILLLAGETIDTKKALSQIVKSIRDELGVVYSDFSTVLLEGLEELSGNEVAWNVKALGVGVDAAILTPSSAQVLAATLSRPMTVGATSELLEPFLKTFSKAQVNRVENVVRQGFFEGQTLGEMTRTIRGTRANNFKDGVLNTTTRNARVIARTAVNHIATQARGSVFEANDEVLKGVEWLSTLDRRTSSICQIRDGIIYPLDSGPRPPAHPSCRSTILPVVKDEFSLFSGNEERPSIGADGVKLVRPKDYFTWLKTQPAAFQDEVLGKGKGQIFRNSGLSTDEFRKLTSNNLDQPLTLEQIRVKEAI